MPTISSPYLYSGQAIWISVPTVVEACAGQPGMLTSGICSNFFIVGKVTGGDAQNFHALKNDGTVWGWGDADFGVVGNGSNSCYATSPQLLPTQVKTISGSYLTNVIDIASGYSDCLALKSDGTVWFWGNFGYSCSDSTNAAVQVTL